MIEGLARSNNLASDTISAGFVLREFAWNKIVEDTAKYTVIDINAIVDGDRNGKLEANKSADRSLVFWYNSDREGTYGQDGPARDRIPSVQTDIVTPGPNSTPPFDDFRDSRDPFIKQTRDLEDFAALSLYVDPLIVNNPNVTFNSYVTLDGNDAQDPDSMVRIRLFDTAFFIGFEDDTRLYLTNETVGKTMNHHSETVLAFDEANSSTLQRFLPGLLSKGANSFIFEAEPSLLTASGQSASSFTSVFENRQVVLSFNVEVNLGGGVTKTIKSSVKLDLHDITDFYDTFHVNYIGGMGEDNRKDPDSGSFTTYSQTTTAVVNSLPNSGFNNDDYIMFVHGWNMDLASKKSFTETAFKRLYWQGYSGRFGTFDWPTFFDAQFPYGPENKIVDLSPLNLTYNGSELQAWRSGAILKSVLGNLRQPDEAGKTHVNLMAHSMGNVVAAEALRQWRVESTAPLVDTYFAMEGAVSSDIYGTNDDDAEGSSNFDLYRNWSGGTDSAAGGRPYMSDDLSPTAQWSQSAATNRVNMYNEQDAATSFAWVKNNALKPFSQ